MRGEPEHAWPEHARGDAGMRKPCLGLSGRQAEGADIDADEVRLDLVRVDRQARSRHAVCEPLRPRVVVRETCDVVVECVEHGSRDDAGLPQRAAEQELERPRSADRSLRSGEDRSERTAEPFREAQRHRVGERAVAGRGDAGGNRGIQQSCAVQVDGQPELVRRVRDRRQLVEGPHTAARAAVRVLEHDDPDRLELVALLHDSTQLQRRDPAGDAGKAMGDEPRVDGGPARLVDQHVRPLLGDEHLTGSRVHAERDLVRHRRSWQEEGVLLAEELGRAPLELVHGRVLARLLVAELGDRHRREHRGSGPGRGVGSEVDHGAQPSLVTNGAPPSLVTNGAPRLASGERGPRAAARSGGEVAAKWPPVAAGGRPPPPLGGEDPPPSRPMLSAIQPPNGHRTVSIPYRFLHSLVAGLAGATVARWT